MAKLPDISALSLDELNELVSAANNRIGELKQTKIDELRAKRAELDAELAKLGASSAKPRMPAGLSDGRKRASPPAKYRTPDGQEWTGRGAIPRAFKELGVTDKADMEKYLIR